MRTVRRIVSSIALVTLGCAAAALTPAPAGAHLEALPSSFLSGTGATADATAPTSVPASCPATTDDSRFESTNQLLADNQVEEDFGQRPTGSPAHTRFIDWLDRQFSAIPGITMDSAPYKVDRWTEHGAALAAGASPDTVAPLEISGAVPYAKPTGTAGVTAPLVYVPAGTALSPEEIAGKIVVRDAVPGSVPYADFRAVEWFEWDPDGTMAQEIGGTYERDFAGYNQRVTDLQDAAAGGAAGLVFVHGFPTSQVRDQYAPYEGTHWQVPAVYVGADQGERLKELAAAGGAAQITLGASDSEANTRTLIATLPGQSPERMVIESHTDGMNAIWDNGPIAILGLARYYALLPLQCRPRTLQFVLTTGHLYQRLLGQQDRGGGAEQEAKQLDADYDQGTVALIFAMEHLGAREYAAYPRTDGGPGRVLAPTGRTELNTLFVGESPALIEGVDQEVMSRDLRRTFVLRGADAPAAFIPPQNSYGGEGGAYQQHLLPTIALVTGPWTLYNPSFGMEAIDGALMRKQTLLFSDLIQRFSTTPRDVIGGGYLGYRAARALICQSGFTVMQLTRCPGDPYG